MHILRPSFPPFYISAEPLYRIQSFVETFFSSLVKEPSHHSCNGLQLRCRIQRIFTCLYRLKKTITLVDLLYKIIARPIPTSSFMLVFGFYSNLPFIPTQKESKFVSLGFLIRCIGTESLNVNRICFWSDKKCSRETSQFLNFYMSPNESRVISFTSNIYARL